VKKRLMVTAALVAAVAVLIAFTLPPRRLVLQAQTDGTIPGIFHVHTSRSDGLSGPDEIAAAAARAGLKFVVFTDHGDATRAPDPPQYRSGVLCLDGVEVSTTGGHYIAIDMPAAPYPLGGDPRDVVEDVRRLGGFGIAAHPDSPKPQLRWREWTAPVDAVEILNLDTSWRQWAQQANAPANQTADASRRWPARRRLLAALAGYPFRPAETIGSLVQTDGVMSQWAALASRRRVVTLAGADAHAKLGLRADPADSSFVLPFPGYESSFRTMSVHVAADRPLTGNAATDAALLTRAIRAGHLYTALDSVATPPSLEFTATNSRGAARAGDELAAGGPVTLHVRSNAPAAFTTIVWNGSTVLSTDHHEQDFTVGAPDGPGVYWVEVRTSNRTPDVAWLTSNPVYVRDAGAPTELPGRPPATISRAIFDGRSVAGWRVEHDPTSLTAVDPAPTVGATELRFRFGLAGGPLVGQVAALVVDTPGGVAAGDRVTFTMRAEQPMRLSVQVRADDGSERWARSVYLDASDQEHTVFFDDMVPMGQTRTLKPALSSVRSLLFVVDTTNTKPGASGRVWMKRAALEK
jgi:predicted metal-dependent phosphoesterase TrpH